ncbi:MAG: HsdR family type I site-specific deoxyribonuclease [Cellulomonadaceae bacterium]|jgi:type I restriction enzyme R subunit|nr:HsdR family type I site-specific deoxyribonuclease [Cellulomonadaceae bacterium]
MVTFTTERNFEDALVDTLQGYGWTEVIENPSEETLVKNWADILFRNNREIDRLNNCPLTEGEMQQILEQINELRTPLRLNGFINGKTVSVKRDNTEDELHLGKEVSLKIYDRFEIAGGKSRYQIARQPRFRTRGILNDRRGDLMLLINGMPVIHIELKKSGVSVTQAANQIEKYAREGIFTGLYSLVQIFVAMEPSKTLYFANPGPDGTFNSDFYFQWADFDNQPINDWSEIAKRLLSIPMAHQMIGFYTVPDDADGVLKVMRSYQYYAAAAISNRVSRITWNNEHQRGGYVWHTTGSGKTMTSFKSAQLIAKSKDADKVIFLMDRRELGTQSLLEYQSFAEDGDAIQATEDTVTLISKIKSEDPANVLIVTSIQKMSRVTEDSDVKAADITTMTGKRIVFIVDECHRSTFGDMLSAVKGTFANAVFFGFTGTPIQDENKIKASTTADVFGNELHRYSIADGIRDQNVLGFDPYKVLTYGDMDVRKAVALDKAKATSEEEAICDDTKRATYYHYLNDVPMVGVSALAPGSNSVRGIEDHLSASQYDRDEHRAQVVKDISDNWLTLSRGGKFHAIFATSSIPEAIRYYRLLKERKPDLKITALFDPNIDNGDGGTSAFKEAGLVEIVQDYNERYNQTFTLGTHAGFKKDLAARLAHKKPHQRIEGEPSKNLDLLIVVDQMLTGFDSKWVNTLYLDKVLEYQHIIQAFSRTNRIFGPEKPFGTIRYYRKPHTMETNIQKAVKAYSGDKEFGLFVPRLVENIKALNDTYGKIQEIFTNAGVGDFTNNPTDQAACARFALLFREFNGYLEAAKIQGFHWSQLEYTAPGSQETVTLALNENDYLVLALRYRELFSAGDQGTPGGGNESVPYDIVASLTQIDTGKIDADYMNSRFDKYLKLRAPGSTASAEEVDKVRKELHSSFATLSLDGQKYAGQFLWDMEKGDVTVDPGMTLRDYITLYQNRAESAQISRLDLEFGLDVRLLSNLMGAHPNEANLNEFGRFDELKATADQEKVRTYFAKKQGKPVSPFKANSLFDDFLRRFIIAGGFDLGDD